MHHFQITEHIRLRFAEKKDIGLLLEFIRKLAEYEHLLDKVEATEAGLRQAVLEDKSVEVIFCEYGGKPAGFALFFTNFSTFLGKSGIYIEDLFVLPELRGKGLGKIILAFIAELAVERNYGRLELACLDWNEPSIAFYKNQGAQPLSEWTSYRVEGKGLKTLAQGW
ncbi:MAG: GNAT family N-acetyltransferase [Treponema sp.]|jgi:GNAT superfamily N-acetyltransferase|nr:GNAT family N-acetyltransferase [Treponema sp.]